MVAPDRRGGLSKAAGVLALNSLRVYSASVNSYHGAAINSFVVAPHFGAPPPVDLLRQQLTLAVDGELDVIASLERRERDAAQSGRRVGEPVPGVPINPPAAPSRPVCTPSSRADCINSQRALVPWGSNTRATWVGLSCEWMSLQTCCSSFNRIVASSL